MPTRTRETYQNGVLVTTEQIEYPQEEANLETMRTKAQQALAANATYLALPNPSNAQNLAQIRALTRECNALIRLLLGALDSADGT